MRNSTIGRSRVFECGLPQGSAFSPNPLIVNISNLEVDLDDLVQFSFADDTCFHVNGNS